MENGAVPVKICGRTYPLKLSTNAMEAINERFGSAYKAVEQLSSSSAKTIERLKIAVFLVSVLATEGARSHNWENPSDPPIPDLPEDIAGTVLTIADLGNITPAIQEAMNIGLGRTVFSMPDDDEKNPTGA